jgi:hypothetical protein
MDLKEILGDLLTLEVNTIIKDGMTANKMPVLPFALLDILNAYAARLASFGVDLEPYFAHSREQLGAALDEKVKNGDAKAKKLIDEAAVAYQTIRGEPVSEQTAAQLFDYLADLWPVLDRTKLPSMKTREEYWKDNLTNGWDSFERLRIAANECRDDGKHSKSEGVMLTRIIGNCSRLKFIVQGVQRNPEVWSYCIPKTRKALLMGDMHGKGVPLDQLGTQHQATIRKIWEVGTEEIVVQTSIQIDGDVLTRISPELLEQHSQMVRELILAAHRESIGTSLSYWKLLIEVAQQLSKLLFRKR